jgi:hypothetical protein
MTMCVFGTALKTAANGRAWGGGFVLNVMAMLFYAGSATCIYIVRRWAKQRIRRLAQQRAAQQSLSYGG